MRITKKGQAYIELFAKKANKPVESVAERVKSLSQEVCSSESGMVLARQSDFEPGFDLYLKLVTVAEKKQLGMYGGLQDTSHEEAKPE